MKLWHYTSFDVLTSIFSSELPTIRASHIHHLNDSRELKHGVELLERFFESSKAITGERYLNSIKKISHIVDDASLFSFSLSEAEDSLYQWLAYCPANGGLALGFEFEEIDITENTPPAFFLFIPNTDSYQLPMYRKCEYLSPEDDVDYSFFCERSGKTDNVNIITNAMFLKHSAFYFEKEHRLFFHPEIDGELIVPLKFNACKPFIEFHFNPKVLSEIYISPRGNKDVTLSAVKKLLMYKGLRHIEVKVSEIPFRD